MSSSSVVELPKQFCDAHHHFLDTGRNSFQANFLGRLVPHEVYLPIHYHRDVVLPLKKAGIKVVGSVHVECMPDIGSEDLEVAWVDSFSSRQQEDRQQEEHDDEKAGSTVQAIVASCDLTQSTVEEDLCRLLKSSNKVRGIRWILDCVGKFGNGQTATHVATSRHDGIDYLRADGQSMQAVPEFEQGFSLLEKFGLSFDLQCAPAQLKSAAALFSRYPKIPVCIDHLGKPRMLLGPNFGSNNEGGSTKDSFPDEAELCTWREGMKALAGLAHVHVKISMLGYCVPGWIKHESRISVVRMLVRETVELFGPQRCMVATNWWKDAAMSDSDGLSDVGPDPVQLVMLLHDFLYDYSAEARNAIFYGTAMKFYKFN